METLFLGCSGCLIEAIERGDAVIVRQLLSSPNVQFKDTYWASRSSRSLLKAPHPHCRKCFPVLTSYPLLPRYRAFKECTHPVLEECLFSGQPPNIAMSVVLTAMLRTREDFNALQILAESKKFDLSDPVLFHWKRQDEDWNHIFNWELLSVSPAGLALLLDSGSSSADPNSFLLLKTLRQNSVLEPETELRIMKIRASKDAASAAGTAIPEWDARCARGALSFLVGANWAHEFASELHGNCNRLHHSRILSLLRALNDMDLLCLHLDTSTAIEYRRLTHYRKTAVTLNSREGPRYKPFESISQLLASFDIRKLAEIISSGWHCALSGENCLYRLVCAMHQRHNFKDLRAGLFQIARQLFALGLFRDPKLQRPRRSYISELTSGRPCQLCLIGQKPERSKDCPFVTPLMNEFFRQPLSLQQLSRIQIRRSLGMKEFERRAKALPLPPSLITYIWQANEYLANVKSKSC